MKPKVKPKLRWKPQVAGDAMAEGYMLRKTVDME